MLEFVSEGGHENTPLLTLTGGFLYDSKLDLAVTAQQVLSMAFAEAQQARGALHDFSTDITLQGDSTITLTPLTPTDGSTILRCDLRGTGDVLIEPGAQLTVSDGALVDLSGDDPNTGCADPNESVDWGLITVDGTLWVQDSTVRNTRVSVNAGDLTDSTTIYNNEINLVQYPPGWGGEFFVEGTSTIECNVIRSDGDRYLDLDPDPDSPNPNIGTRTV